MKEIDSPMLAKTGQVKTAKVNRVTVVVAIATFTCVALVLLASPAFAHHPMGGRTPASWFEGLMSGLGHPVIGLDHLTFVVAMGLLAATQRWRMVMPISFLSAGLVGTGLHLMSWSLPVPEIVVSGSVLVAGWMIVRQSPFNAVVGAILAAIAGVFHGYAYGEAIIGAESGALVAYLVGFTLIQAVISLGAYQVAQALWRQQDLVSQIKLRHAGFLICGVGLAFLSSAVLG
jgi:urease accessory protein